MVGKKPPTKSARLTVVESYKDREIASGGTRPAIMLESGRRLAGSVRQFGYTYYKIVARRDHADVTPRCARAEAFRPCGRCPIAT